MTEEPNRILGRIGRRQSVAEIIVESQKLQKELSNSHPTAKAKKNDKPYAITTESRFTYRRQSLSDFINEKRTAISIRNEIKQIDNTLKALSLCTSKYSSSRRRDNNNQLNIIQDYPPTKIIVKDFDSDNMGSDANTTKIYENIKCSEISSTDQNLLNTSDTAEEIHSNPAIINFPDIEKENASDLEKQNDSVAEEVTDFNHKKVNFSEPENVDDSYTEKLIDSNLDEINYSSPGKLNDSNQEKVNYSNPENKIKYNTEKTNNSNRVKENDLNAEIANNSNSEKEICLNIDETKNYKPKNSNDLNAENVTDIRIMNEFDSVKVNDSQSLSSNIKNANDYEASSTDIKIVNELDTSTINTKGNIQKLTNNSKVDNKIDLKSLENRKSTKDLHNKRDLADHKEEKKENLQKVGNMKQKGNQENKLINGKFISNKLHSDKTPDNKTSQNTCSETHTKRGEQGIQLKKQIDVKQYKGKAKRKKSKTKH